MCLHPEEKIKITEVTFKNNTKHLERRCGDCNKHLDYAPHETDVRKRRIHFGKYKGKTLEEVGRSDRPYLEWLYKQQDLKPSLRAQIEELFAWLD